MKRLTEAAIDRIAAPSKGRLTVFDSVAPGLALRVTANDVKSFAVVTRIKGSRKTPDGRDRQAWITLAVRPGPGRLEVAREQAREIQTWASEGRDPRRMLAARQADVARETETTVKAVYERYMKRLKGGAKSARTGRTMAPATLTKIEATFKNDVLPKLGAVPIAEVTRADVLAILDAKADAGRAVAANRARAYLRVFFEYAHERGLVAENVVAGTKKAAKELSRERALSNAELRAVWLAADALPWQACAAVRLLVLTGQRPNEVAGMRWSEIDREARIWRLPGARTKNSKDHEVHLARFAADLIEALPLFAHSDLVLGSNRRARLDGQVHEAHISLGSKFKAALDARIAVLAEAGKGAAVAPWQWRDLRRSAATGMERIGVSPRVVARVLNHSPPGLGVTGVYARHEYQQEAAAALDAWAQHVAELVATGNVIALAERAS